MPFPKSPEKRVKGKLTLMIAPPGFTQEVEAKPTQAFGDADGVIKFKPPTGFSIDMGHKAVVTRQVENVKKRIEEIKSGKCKSCRRATSVWQLEMATDIVMSLSVLALLPEQKTSIVFGQKPEGDLTLDVVYGPKQVSFIIAAKEISAGLYESDTLVKELEGEESMSDLLPFLRQC
jgi:hypothetical protein